MGVSNNLLYIMADALSNLRANLATTLLSALTVGFSLSICTLFLVVLLNLNAVAEKWGERTHIVAYLKHGAERDGIGRLKRKVAAIVGVESVEFVSAENAIELLKQELKGYEGALEGLDEIALPASFEIRLSPTQRSAEGIETVASRIAALGMVEDVQYGTEWVKKFTAFVNFIEVSALGIGFFLAVAAVFMISNTIRLAVYARKDEIEVMQLVGASNMYVKVPFYIEGVVQGFIGGFAALGMLSLGHYLMVMKIPSYMSFVIQNPFTPAMLLLMLVAAGVMAGFAGSALSLGRFLKL